MSNGSGVVRFKAKKKHFSLAFLYTCTVLGPFPADIFPAKSFHPRIFPARSFPR